jgi:hypothetical protein
MAKGKKKGPLIAMIVAPLVLGGGVVGAALTGAVNIPGLTPKKAKPPAGYGERKDEKPAAKKPAAPPEEAPPAANKEPERDPEAGAKKLAQFWNNVETRRLVEIAKGYRDDDLAPILVKMDPEKVAEILAAIEPARATKLSQQIQSEASLVPESRRG